MNKLSDGFLDMLEQDIRKADILLNEKDNDDDFVALHKELDSKYQSCFDNWGDGMYGYNPDFGFHYEMISAKHNVEIMLGKMKALLAQRAPFIKNSGININSHLSNLVDVNISITFDAAREKIENMTALSETQIKEILEKINDIQKIVESSEPKHKKWNKLRDIIKWVADKGVDVGIALLPLLLKID